MSGPMQWWWVLAALVLVGCGGQTEATDRTEPNWLGTCESDEDCQGGLSCLCDRCTVECDRASECGQDGSRLTCAPPSGCEDATLVCARTDGEPQGSEGDRGDASVPLCSHPAEDCEVLGPCDADLDCDSVEDACDGGCLDTVTHPEAGAAAPIDCPEDDRRYVARSSQACAVVDFSCDPRTEGPAFDDECGCGCLFDVVREPFCGDGFVDPGEECDEVADNGLSGRHCTADCRENVCGDGFLGPGEFCDDGNDVDDDECSNECATIDCGSGIVSPLVQCDDGNTDGSDSCLNTCLWNSCGDGIVLRVRNDDESPYFPEECDDGNTIDDDECTNDCKNPACGDGIVQAARDEECDDGNTVDTDDCTNECHWAICGDGIRGPNELCDDGNNVDDDDCTNTCTPPGGCGDGITQPQYGEECDDGNDEDGDGCTNECRNAVCGDGIVGPGEACDDGNDVDCDDCNNDCVIDACGNGVVSCTEECDDGNASNTDGCLNTCALARCGDGFVRDGVERCDLGEDNGAGADCTAECGLPNCGNGVVDPFEECDDGNAVDDDLCTNGCTTPG
jgi:cysteine-rich repeat protein